MGKHNDSSDNDNFSSSWDDGLGNTRNICSRHECNKQNLVNYPHLITTFPHLNLAFSDSNRTSFDTVEDLGNIPVDLTQTNCQIVRSWMIQWPFQ
jgi:hypothetical protein